MPEPYPLADTFDQMLREQLPNLFRPYLNPYVVQTCLCLSQYAAMVRGAGRRAGETHGASTGGRLRKQGAQRELETPTELAPWVSSAGESRSNNSNVARKKTMRPCGPAAKRDEDPALRSDFQSFLANGFDEALSGAIKLARYAASVEGRPTTGLVIDPAGRLGPFASAEVAGGKVEFIPGLVVASNEAELRAAAAAGRFGFVVLATPELPLAASQISDANPPAMPTSASQISDADSPAISVLASPICDAASGNTTGALPDRIRRDGAMVITCVSRETLSSLRGSPDILKDLASDIVVFDETFVDRRVPFGAFAATYAVYDHWNQPGKGTFHSTTFQPNTISTLHFMNCLKRADAPFFEQIAAKLERIGSDIGLRGELFKRLYSPMLYGATRQTGCDVPDVRAAGSFVHINGRRIFDGVSGVACSVRGHNPASYLDEIRLLDQVPNFHFELNDRLRRLTGLEHMLPATSGGSAVENALKVALVAQFPRKHVLALKAGFGGKTLFALTGTWKSSYKERVDPLYADVVYVDPFAPEAVARIDAILAEHDIAVVQIELIQGVGGVRRIPETVVRHLAAGRERFGYLLLVDEVQTGMYRTGPFTISGESGLSPDLLVVGKGVSDMMFPFALLLYSNGVQAKLDAARSDLPAQIRDRYGYEYGYKTALNVMRHADQTYLAERVADAGRLCTRLLGEGLASCKAVREVRVFGMLIGIELNASGLPQRFVRKRLFWFYLLGMLRHPRFPVLVGFCQYEPNILKITPPLSASDAELRGMCQTLIEVLRRPLYRLAAAAVANLVRVKSTGQRRSHDRRNDQPGGAPGRGRERRPHAPAAV